MESWPRKVKLYRTPDGRSPFEQWFFSLRDGRTRAKIRTCLDRVEAGNLGKYRSVGMGVYELKINFGPGYRIYFGMEQDDIILLLCGGDKNKQWSDIKRAQEYLESYRG
ncbi:MAG: type II toxin-antitoxin system RelE/ParE family toxin [Deltaproteobacteria bacterium]|nr:type II toxin-antitoxin system RelE/ParE family toxin [Deltaproteobacteria bacterium]